jgi:N-acetylmuramoyl-L-alanine amidase
VSKRRLIKMKILIDPGHGGSEVGCSGFGKLEKNLNLIYARALSIELKNYMDVNVIMIRNDDSEISINERARIINLEKPDLCLSCHLNACNGEARGTETIYSISAEKTIVDLAKKIASNISSNLKIPLRRSFSRKSGNWDYYGVIRAWPKTIIIEPLFLDNKQDAMIVFENNWYLNLAKIISDTIARHYKLVLSKVGKVYNVTSSLNVRSGPTINFKIIGSLKNDSIVKIYSSENNFYKISFGTGFGYVSKDYIKIL